MSGRTAREGVHGLARRGRAVVRRRAARRGFDSRLIWLLGSPRSGSTWLLTLLADHPDVVPINEPLIGLYLGPFLSDLPGWDGESLDLTNFTLRRFQEDKRHQFFAREFDAMVIPALGELLRKRFLAHSLRYPPKGSLARARVVVKEPSGSQSADLLLRAMPTSRLLFLLRDGRDVVDSELSANLRGSWVAAEFPGAKGFSEHDRYDFVVQSAQKWLWRTEVVEAAMEAHGGAKHRVKYEELLAEPMTHLTEILEWMGSPVDSHHIQEILERHSFDRVPVEQRGSDKFYRAASPGLWREHLTPEEQAALDRIIGPKLRELGYAA